MHTKFIAISTQFVLMCFIRDFVSAHIDEPCTLGFCFNAISIPIKNAYCDSSYRCRCEKGFVQVSRHKCSESQKHGSPCEHENVCKFNDENLTCDRTRFKPVCECRKGFHYEHEQKKCIPQIKKPKSTPLFPITAVILIACIGIFCGCGIICHNFRRQPELSLSVEQLRRVHRNQNAAESAPVRNVQHYPNVSESQNHPPLLRNEINRAANKHDSLLYNDPPPKYEDAIKDYPSEVVVAPSANIQLQLGAIKS